jgi:N-acetylneuraminic acid mutarotase
MKMFRPALAGVLPAFVLFVCIQLNARVASTPPPDMHSWFTGDDTVNNHIWQPAGRLYNGATYAAAKIAAPSQSSQLFFEDRVAYQRAIEEVYWRHRLWPKERPDRKPSLDAVMSQATIEKKVEDYLRNSELLEHSWQKPITPEQLQAEMDRMAQHSKQPEVLRELFAALGNDPFVIAECLARPVLSERFANGDPVAAGVPPAHPSRMPPQKPFLAGWLAKAETRVPVTMAAANASYTLPVISDQPSGCIDDSWTATTMSGAPARRYRHTAVWTGSEMIVWGGLGVLDTSLNTGGRYNPSTDSWTATSTTNAPDGRWLHTAVWTGSEMIVWGGFNGSYLNTGGRYNPGTDSWTATSTTNAPEARSVHTAVWNGSVMIVWGGGNFSGPLNTGGRYNPGTDSWTATSTTNAPTARGGHTAVWTGSEMIVWGGGANNTGGRYNPGTNSWTATSTTNAPTGRDSHKAVWTGSEMIVWGGFDGSYLNTGGRYNPGTNSWTATTTTNAPTGRWVHTAVWIGSEMIVWGGYDGTVYLKTGGRYNPGTDSWTATSTTNAPTVRGFHTAVLTSSEMIVWGGINNMPPDPVGRLNTGGRYCAQASGPITLSAAKRKVGGINTVRLTWSGATSTDIDVYRDGVVIVTTANDGSYTDSTGDTGRAQYTYRVCEAGTSTCSNNAIVTFPH